MTLYLTELANNDDTFPSPYEALQDPNGLLAFGGDLSPSRLLTAYSNGIFPWYGPGEPILWWSPAPRAVFYPETFQPSRSLKKFQKKAHYSVSINQCTHSVIDYCASTRAKEETWLNTEMRESYKKLASLGHCHSVEVWNKQELIGGLYGINMGQIFCGESMFSLKDNASKIGLWFFCQHYYRHHGRLIDCQILNPHLASLGAVEIDRDQFINALIHLQNQPIIDACFAPQWLSLETR